MLGLQMTGRAPSERLAADGVEKRRRRRGGGDWAPRAWFELELTFALPAGQRRGAGSADLVVHAVVEEVVQVHLKGLVLRLRVGADVGAR